MARRGKHRARLNWIVILLVSAVAAFCILTTLQDKYDLEIMELPALSLPSIEALYGYVEEFTGGESGGGSADREAVPAEAGEGLTVHVLDMGQADSILICGPERNVLIDAGENGQGAQVLRYLEEQGVKKLDLVIGTHPHSDHIGGMDTVIEGFAVGQVVLPEIPDEILPTTTTYTDLLRAIADKGLRITAAEPGLRFELGDGAVLTILGPVAEFSDLNNMSVVSKLTYGNTSFLFTGDVSEKGEAALLERGSDLKADVMQAPHHGSSSSSTAAFLDAASPRVAFISCGLDNSYGHPHREVMERLEERGIQILRTDLDGPISIYSDAKNIYISTR